MIRKSTRGVDVDLEKLRLAHEATITVGNTKTNARGDQLGSGGKITTSAAQIARQHYAATSPKVQRPASIKIDAPPAPTDLEEQSSVNKKPTKKDSVSEND